MVYAVLLSSLLLYLAFPNYLMTFGMPSLAWIFAMPFCWLLAGQRLFARAALAGLVGLLFFGGFVSWMANYNFFGYLGFVLVLAVQFAIFAVFFPSNFKNALVSLLYVPAAWVSAEYLHRWLLGGFSWTIGYSQAFNTPLIQIAAACGSHGVSFFLILTGYCLLQATRDYRRRWIYLTLALFSPAILYLTGYFPLHRTPQAPHKTFSVLLLQPNISGEDRKNPDAVGKVLERHIQLTASALTGHSPQLIIWPETAITDDIFLEIYAQPLTYFIRQTGSNFLVGSALLRNKKDYNSAVLFDDKGIAADVYDKIHVVPFAEYVPDNGLMKFLAAHFRRNTFDFQPGRKPGLLRIGETVFGVTICSEDHYPRLFRKLKNGGGEFAVVMLNDGWFNQDGALLIHAQSSVFRAVENGLPILRDANTGLTASITGYGDILLNQSPPLNTPAFQPVELAIKHNKTFYAKFGDLFAQTCLCFVIINFIKPLFRKTHE